MDYTVGLIVTIMAVLIGFVAGRESRSSEVANLKLQYRDEVERHDDLKLRTQTWDGIRARL